jgi:hypothetical protein
MAGFLTGFAKKKIKEKLKEKKEKPIMEFYKEAKRIEIRPLPISYFELPKGCKLLVGLKDYD